MSQPNIVMLFIDDLGARDLGCFGSTFYETPNLDRLAHDGMLFSNAYATCPVCSPTRASLMSGKYPARVGITQYIGGNCEARLKDVPYLHYLPLEETSVASALSSGGYQTWHVGKWHLGGDAFKPQYQGFDVNIGGSHAGHPHKGYFSPWQLEELEVRPEGEYLTDHLTDEAVRLIRNRGENPFYLQLSHYAVHTPIQAPEALVDKYRQKAKRLGLDTIEPIVPGKPNPRCPTGEWTVMRRILQSDPTYAAMMENLDTNIGRLLAVLDEEGLAENTVVCFTSDNGGLSTSEGSPTCNSPFAEGKGWNYEGGTRVCQMVRWPGVVPPSSTCDEVVQTCDFYPTFLEIAGLPLMPEQHVDGESMMPLLKGEGELSRDAIFWHYPHYSNQGGAPAASMRSGKWKLIENFEDGTLELYDLEHDVGEMTNVADRHAQRTGEMHRRLQAWQKEVEALIPEQNPEWPNITKRPLTPNNAHV
jgi:arylsulfatase A-like enzyme